jgi:hypothetical protein
MVTCNQEFFITSNSCLNYLASYFLYQCSLIRGSLRWHLLSSRQTDLDCTLSEYLSITVQNLKRDWPQNHKSNSTKSNTSEFIELPYRTTRTWRRVCKLYISSFTEGPSTALFFYVPWYYYLFTRIAPPFTVA